MTEEMNNDDSIINNINYNIYKPIINNTETKALSEVAAPSKMTWTVISNNGKLKEDNEICNINTVRIGPPTPSTKKMSKLPLTLGEENEIVRQWETYFNEKINNNEFSLFTNAALILLQLKYIHNQDKEMDTMNFQKIIDKYLPLIEALIKISNFS